MTSLKTLEREFDIFAKEDGAWHFAERVKAPTLEEAKAALASIKDKA